MGVILAVISLLAAELSMCAFCFIRKKDDELVDHQPHGRFSLN